MKVHPSVKEDVRQVQGLIPPSRTVIVICENPSTSSAGLRRTNRLGHHPTPAPTAMRLRDATGSRGCGTHQGSGTGDAVDLRPTPVPASESDASRSGCRNRTGEDPPNGTTRWSRPAARQAPRVTLTYIYGISQTRAAEALSHRRRRLPARERRPEADVIALRDYIDANFRSKVTSAGGRRRRSGAKVEIRCWGIRHRRGLPVQGPAHPPTRTRKEQPQRPWLYGKEGCETVTATRPSSILTVHDLGF